MIIIRESETHFIIECPICKQIFKVLHSEYIEPFPHSNCEPTSYSLAGSASPHKFLKGNKHGFIHGHAGKHSTKEGRTVEYHCWDNLYKGGKSKRWRDYTTFLADLGYKPSPLYRLRRLDTTKVHSRGNTIWSTANIRNPGTSTEWTTKSIDVILEKNKDIDLTNYINYEQAREKYRELT